MLLQRDNYSCGVYAIVNACLALGHDHRSQVAQIRQWAGTTSAAGTSERGIVAALQELQYDVSELRGQSLDRLWTSVWTAIARSCAVILCVDGVDHWVAVIGSIGSGETGRVVIFDSQRDVANDGETSGVLVYDRKEFKKRLGGSRYGLVISDVAEEMNSLGRVVTPDVNDDVMASIMNMVSDSQSSVKLIGDSERGLSSSVMSVSMPADLATWLLRGAGT